MTITAMDFSAASGFTKEIFGELNEARMESTVLQNIIKFDTENKLGEALSEAVWLTRPTSVSYNPGANDLEDGIASQSQEFRLSGKEVVVREAVILKLLASAQGDRQAFRNLYKQLITNIYMEAKRRLEIQLMYGGLSIGRANAAATGSSTTRDVVISAATWAPGMWAGAEGTRLDAYNSTTQLNTNAVILVTGVDFDTRTVSLSGNATDLTALTSAGTAAEFYFRGAYGNEPDGLIKIVGLTGSYGNINAASFTGWKGNTQSCAGGDLTFDLIGKLVAKAMGRGGLEDNVIVICGNDSWNGLNTQLQALRTIDQSFKPDGEVGHEGISYRQGNVRVKVKASPFCKGGDAAMFPESGNYHARVGATDVTMENPASKGDYIITHTNKHVAEFRCWYDQALKMRAPAKCGLFTNVVTQ